MTLTAPCTASAMTTPALTQPDPARHPDIPVIGPMAGTWTWNVLEDRWWWSDEIYAIHGFEPGEVVPTTALILAHKVVDDLEKCRSTLASAKVRPGPFSNYHRIIDTRTRHGISRPSAAGMPTVSGGCSGDRDTGFDLRQTHAEKRRPARSGRGARPCSRTPRRHRSRQGRDHVGARRRRRHRVWDTSLDVERHATQAARCCLAACRRTRPGTPRPQDRNSPRRPAAANHLTGTGRSRTASIPHVLPRQYGCRTRPCLREPTGATQCQENAGLECQHGARSESPAATCHRRRLRRGRCRRRGVLGGRADRCG